MYTGVDPIGDSVARRVSDLDVLVSFESLSSPQGALPAHEIHDFLIGNCQAVDGSEQACMVGESTQTHAVRSMAVVQAGVASLNAVQTAVEGGRLDADFRNEVTRKMSLKVGWVRGTRTREEVGVEERGHRGLPAHDGCDVVPKSRAERRSGVRRARPRSSSSRSDISRLGRGEKGRRVQSFALF
jgi:hypothetical protein